MATAFGVRVAWYRFGSPFDAAAMIGNSPTASFVPKVCRIGGDYQSGTKLPALQRLRLSDLRTVFKYIETYSLLLWLLSSHFECDYLFDWN